MLILQPPTNTDDLHLRPAPLGVCFVCVCARLMLPCVCVCVFGLWGLTDEATGGPATCVCLCGRGGWETGEMILFSVYVGASEGGAMFKGCWEGNWPVFLGLYQLRCSHQIICHLFKNYLGVIREISLAVYGK